MFFFTYDDENEVEPSLDETQSIFESIKHINEYGQEFWYARELSKTLEYKDFRNFELAIYKAMEACSNSGEEVSDHFGDVTEMVLKIRCTDTIYTNAH